MQDTHKKVLDYYTQIPTLYRDQAPVPILMAALAQGIVAVVDDQNECDAFFEVNEWQYTYPDIWRGTRNSLLRRLKLRKLPGLGSAPRVTDIAGMFTMAKGQLIAQQGRPGIWFTAPNFIHF